MSARLAHQIGDTINQDYVIHRHISSGGMGSVYMAEQRSSSRFFAVKECDILDDPRGRNINRDEALRRFEREGNLLQQCSHPGIPAGFLFTQAIEPTNYCLRCANQVPQGFETCSVCSPGSDSLYFQPMTVHQRHYLFMDYVEGDDLASQFTNTPKPLAANDLRTLLNWFQQLCDILQYLHGQQLVHRDIKPQNIRIRQDGRLYLLDYGLLEEVRPPKRTLVLNPQAQGYGTQGYAPPEQDSQAPSYSNDIYALAMTLLATATGDDPANPLLKQELTATDPQRLVPDLQPSLANLIQQSLKQDPSQRPSIELWQQTMQQSLQTTPPPIPQPQKNHSRRSFLLVSVLLLVVLGGFLPSYFNSGPTWQATAREGTLLYKDPQNPRNAQPLKRGSKLEVKPSERKESENWLKVVRVDGKKRSGFVKRNGVDVQR